MGHPMQFKLTLASLLVKFDNHYTIQGAQHFEQWLLQNIVSKVKSATLVKGDLMAPFSIATTPRCRGGRYSFPWISPL